MSFDWWMLTAGANAVLVLIYGAIAVIMIRGIVDGRQLLTNPILTATAAIFVMCTAGHGVHLFHAVAEGGTIAGIAARSSFADPRLLVWDLVTASVAIWYWTLRTRFALLFKGAALCEDMAKRQTQAMELHDNVVQGLVRAKLALDLGRREDGAKAVEETLDASKRIISGLLGGDGATVRLGAGDLRRDAPGR
ncbi:MAG TPA: hypothetical protein VI997_08830 [Candidatus Thermoplasmatota archaeon]|nr:hypothetical protein [Candidatus Thermoplasmatota archaeon]